MARSWNGFAAQNELVKAQWRLLEAGPTQVARWTASLSKDEERDGSTRADEEDLFIPPEPDAN